MYHLSATAAGPGIFLDPSSDERTVLVDGLPRTALIAPRTITLRHAYDEEGLACRFCGSAIEPRRDGNWVHVVSGLPECVAEEAVCPTCNGPIVSTINEGGEELWVHIAGGQDGSAAHEVPTPVATQAASSLDWLDAITIEVDERAKTLTIGVAVYPGEPLGPPTQLAVTIREDGEGDLLLKLPRTSRTLPIMPLGRGRYLLR